MSARDLLLQKGPLTFGVVSLVLLLSYVIIQPHMTSPWGMQGTDTIDKERDGHQQWTPTTTYEATGVTVGGPYISQRQQQEQHHQQQKQQQYHQQQQTEGQLQQQQNQQQQQQQQQHQQTEQKQQPFTTTTLRDIATTHFPSAMSTTPKDESNSNNSCQFPNQNPFDPDVMKHFVKPPSLNCSRDTLPSIVYHNGTHLRVNQTKVLQIHVDFQYCYYVSLSRDSERVVSHSRRSQSFTNSIELDKQHIDVVVTCMLNKTRVAKSYISIIRKNDQIEISCQENYKNHVYNNSPVETLSVLMIGLDGTSRQNSIRSLLMSRQFLLQNLSAIELYKYNKVGDNTFPNVVALLTGMSIEELSKHWTRKDHFDKVDDFFLWNDYKSAGYRTAMMFDDSWLTTFHYLRKGWKDPPFHYYHRNMLVELQKHKNKRLCIGDTPKVTHLLNYYIELCTTFNNTRTQPYFAYAFSSMITHNDPNLAVLADSVYLDFFRELSRRNVLNNTLVIWFSDHGARFGPIRETRAGVMESKTPFIFFVFPEWFRNKYSDVMDSFRKNQHTLTTPYDVYATLKDLLYFKGSHTTMGQLSSRGISLFKEIPRERTCKHAGVPTEFCMCSRELKNYTILPEVEFEVASIVLESVVNATSQYRDVCVVLKLESIKSIYPSAPPEFDKCSKCVNFLTTIEVCPSGGEYEATVQYNPETGKSRVRGEIIRLNMYKGQADCVDTPSLRLFCYCKHQ